MHTHKIKKNFLAVFIIACAKLTATNINIMINSTKTVLQNKISFVTDSEHLLL